MYTSMEWIINLMFFEMSPLTTQNIQRTSKNTIPIMFEKL